MLVETLYCCTVQVEVLGNSLFAVPTSKNASGNQRPRCALCNSQLAVLSQKADRALSSLEAFLELSTSCLLPSVLGCRILAVCIVTAIAARVVPVVLSPIPQVSSLKCKRTCNSFTADILQTCFFVRMLAWIKLLAMLTLQTNMLQLIMLQSNVLEWVNIASHAHKEPLSMITFLHQESADMTASASDCHAHFTEGALQAVQQRQISDNHTAMVKHAMSLFVTCMSCGWPV